LVNNYFLRNLYKEKAINKNIANPADIRGFNIVINKTNNADTIANVASILFSFFIFIVLSKLIH